MSDSNSDLDYFQKLKNSSVFQLRVTTKFEFKIFKKEIINILKIEENRNSIPNYDEALKDSINAFFQAMDVWLEKNKHLAKV